MVLAGCAADPQPPPDSSEERPESDVGPDEDPSDPEGPIDDDGDGHGGEPTEQPPDLSVALRLEPVVELGSAMSGAVDADGLLHVADRAGTVHRQRPDGDWETVLDLTAETTTDSERGLLGIAFAPDGGELYVSYTDLAGHSVVEAFPVRGRVPRREERRRVLQVEQPFPNHNGGDIAFGPDGMLYVGLGDGGGAGDPLEAGQDRSTLLGAILRVDPRGGDPYEVPADNPYVGVDGAAPEIFAYGLRNPWRFSFDRERGDLWIADVGQSAREEINRLDPVEDAGANLGWNLREGTREFAGPEPDDHHPPVHEYETSSQRCAVTGGYVYRGVGIEELRGAYLFSDYCEGTVRAVVVDDDGRVVDEADLGIDGGRVVSFAQDANGELYVLALDGQVWRIERA